MNKFKIYFLFLIFFFSLLACDFLSRRPSPVAFKSELLADKDFKLDTILKKIALRWNYEIEKLEDDTYRIEVSVQQKDSSYHYQHVFVWIIKERHYGNDVVYINSRCGEYTPKADLYKLMLESGYGTYCTVAITGDTRADGTACETVITQAIQPIALTSESILNEVIYDVASSADVINAKYFNDSLK